MLVSTGAEVSSRPPQCSFEERKKKGYPCLLTTAPPAGTPPKNRPRTDDPRRRLSRDWVYSRLGQSQAPARAAGEGDPLGLRANGGPGASSCWKFGTLGVGCSRLLLFLVLLLDVMFPRFSEEGATREAHHGPGRRRSNARLLCEVEVLALDSALLGWKGL